VYHGDGEATFSGGHSYKGAFAEGFMHGRGKYSWADGVTYEVSQGICAVFVKFLVDVKYYHKIALEILTFQHKDE